MKNIFEVIRQKEEVVRQKEDEIQELHKQLDVLRSAARLLADEREAAEPAPVRMAAPTAMPPRNNNNNNSMAAAAASGALKEFP